jgi:endonuclease YncB( thermonuclease family)
MGVPEEWPSRKGFAPSHTEPGLQADWRFYRVCQKNSLIYVSIIVLNRLRKIRYFCPLSPHRVAIHMAPMLLRDSRRPGSVLLAIPAIFMGLTEAHAACASGPQERVAVSSVGDRGEIALGDGRRARLAGLDVPDAGRGDPEIAAEARAWLTTKLAGREVGLRLLAAKADRWGRFLADISVDDGSGPSSASIAVGLVSAGLARVRPEVEASDCGSERLAAEGDARRDGLGVWTDPYYGVVEATDLEELRARDGQFAIVEGVVLRVGQGRSRTYLDFGRRDGFTVVAQKRQAKAFERAGVDFSALQGARIRVRGAMDNRFGLRMAIAGPEGIELMSSSVETGEAKPGK